MINKKSLVGLLILLFSISLAFAGEGIALKDSNCTGKYSITSQKIILPVGYYNNYIKRSGRLLPHKIEFEYNSSNVDTGYIYCVGAKKGAKYKCINNLDKIVKSKDINYVTVDNQRRTYFLLNKKEAILNFNLPLVKALSNNSSVSITLLKHKESSNSEVCLSQDRALKIDLEAFKVGYEINQNIVRDYNRKVAMKSSVMISNPQQVPLKIYDLYSKKIVKSKDLSTSMQMSVYNNKLSGFCVRLDSGFSQIHLKEGSDYFCKTSTYGDFNFAVFHDALNSIEIDDKNNSFIQVGAVKLSEIQKGELPFELLGIEKSARLIRHGYKDLKTTYVGDVVYILVGPFNQTRVSRELRSISRIIPDAIIFNERQIRCKDKKGRKCR